MVLPVVASHVATCVMSSLYCLDVEYRKEGSMVVSKVNVHRRRGRNRIESKQR